VNHNDETKKSDEEKYLAFLEESHLANGMLEQWFDNEMLARAILHVLVRNNLINHQDVIQAFNQLGKKKVRELAQFNLDPDDIPLSADFSNQVKQGRRRR